MLEFTLLIARPDDWAHLNSWSISAILTVLCLYGLERHPGRLPLELAAAVLIYALFILLVGYPSAAAVLTLVLVVLIGVASTVKRRLLGASLVATDFRYALAPAWLGVVGAYKSWILRAALVAVVAVVALALLLERIDEPALPLARRAEFILVAGLLFLVVAWLSAGRRKLLRRIGDGGGHLVSSFLLSFGVIGQTRTPRFLDAAATALPLAAPKRAPGTGAPLPDICLVQHESTFDPRLFGLPVTAELAEFLAPRAGISGGLHVDPFGGASILSEFSVLAGLSARSFGEDRALVFPRLAGKIRHSLPATLAALGYRTVIAYTDRRRSAGVERFFRGLGFQQQIYWSELGADFDADAYARSFDDRLLYPAVLDAVKRDDQPGRPLFLYIATMLNHGPHDRPRFAEPGLDAVRADGWAAAGGSAYAEYWVRQSLGLDAYAELKRRYRLARPERPVLHARYGDHQPSFTAGLARRLRLTDVSLHQTFFAMEAEGFSFDAAAGALPPVLDAAFLGTAMLIAAGLPLDPVFATRASLIEECGADYFGAASERKRRFHRTLLEIGAVATLPAAGTPAVASGPVAPQVSFG